jgi:lycopene beta-cyclase
VLPIALAHDAQRHWQAHERGAAPIGLRAGLFHPTTGYSLPDSVHVANLIATECRPLTTDTVRSAVRAHAIQRNREQAFCRMLNRLLFGAAEPDRRYLVLQRFYKLSQGLIERFYAGRLTTLDKLRILTGKPPVPIRRALRFVEEPKPLASNN